MRGLRRSKRAAIALTAAVLTLAYADMALAEARAVLPPRGCTAFADMPPVASLARYVYVFGAGRSQPAAGQDADLVPAAVRGLEPAETAPEATGAERIPR